MRVFDKDSPSGEIILQWWDDLQSKNGDRALLKRSSLPSETICRVSMQLIEELTNATKEKFNRDKICAIAGILSHIKGNNSMSFAKQLSQKIKGDQPIISDIRFRRILQYSNISEDELFYQKIIRIIYHVDRERKVNILDIFSSLYFWGDSVKKRWAYDYYGTSTSENNQDEQENTIIQGANNE